MNWLLERTDDPAVISTIYNQVYGQPFDANAVTEKRSRGEEIHGVLVREKNGPLAGFGVFAGRREEVELWCGGTLAGQRRKGVGRALLTLGMRELAERGYTSMMVRTCNEQKYLLLLLLQLGFKIHGASGERQGKGPEITLVSAITPKREIRYALTQECNFKCLFCHNEGLGHAKRDSRATNEILEILVEAMRLGYTDITLTGGEPLYGPEQKKILTDLLIGLGALPVPPTVTMVTNGALLKDDIIKSLADYPGDLKINASLHAFDAENFAKVTQTQAELFQVVKNNMRRASAAGIKVKVNCVLLQGINHDRIAEAVEVARDMGAVAIKFLELMVLPEAADDFGMYYDSAAILGQLEKIAKPLPCDNKRRHLFSHRLDDNFKIEVQKCTCALGCAHCRELRDRTFSSDMQYHPCFVRTKISIPISGPEELSSVLQRGNVLIDGFAEKYGDSSPTLIKQEQFVPGKRDFFFEIDSAGKFKEHLARCGYSLVEKKGYYLEHYRPRKRLPAWDNYEKVLKLGWDHHDRSKVSLVYTDQSYRLDEEFGLEVTTRYLDRKGPMVFESLEAARHFLDRFDFENYRISDYHLDIYRRETAELSLANDAEKPTVKFSGTDSQLRQLMAMAKEYDGDFQVLGIPLEKYMAGD